LLLQDLAQQAGEDAALKRTLQHLLQALQLPAAQQEAQARQWVQQLVLLAQACLLRSHAPQAVAEVFVQSRLGLGAAGWVAGAIDIHNMDVDAILQRALPV
ncbi:MAG TPA: DNA alkylation response protein, partial [Comamonas sp.]